MAEKNKKSPFIKLKLADAEISDFRQSGKNALFLPVDISSLVVFRIAFGLIMLWEVVRYFNLNYIELYWLKPAFLFTYWPFDFVKPLPGNGLFTLYYFLGILAFFMAIGFLYRISSILFFLGMSYSFLLEQARYLNHAYLICLISFVMILIPANRSFAIDTKLFKNLRSDVIPSWPVWLLRFMVGLPYFFGGIAKINGDWLQGEPLRIWLASDTDFPIIGSYFTEDWMIYFMCYSGLLFDLLVIPFLLIRRTRKWAFAFMILFNLMNSRLFNIGVFPLVMVFATTIYFQPSWMRNVMNAIAGNARKPLVIPENWNRSFSSDAKRKTLLTGLGLWTAFHVLFPLRHFLIHGNVHWTEEGHKFSWHMKLRTKTTIANFWVKDKMTAEVDTVYVQSYLTLKQQVGMPKSPDMIWQFCKMIKSEYAKQGKDVSVHADVKASLNGRNYQQLVSPDVDMASVSRPVFGHYSWITDLQTPLSSRPKNEEQGDPE